jgi:hypothetical protein
MRACVQVSKADDLELSLQITLTGREARELLEQLEPSVAWPLSDFRRVVREALGKFKERFYSGETVV